MDDETEQELHTMYPVMQGIVAVGALLVIGFLLGLPFLLVIWSGR